MGVQLRKSTTSISFFIPPINTVFYLIEQLINTVFCLIERLKNRKRRACVEASNAYHQE